MKRDYSSILLDHYNNPRNTGSFDEKSPDVGTGTTGTTSCGDVLRLQIKVKNNTITDACFKTFGCGSSIAASSFLTEFIKGKSLDEVKSIKNSDIAKALSLPSIKIHCSVLAEEALSAAISDYQAKQSKGKDMGRHDSIQLLKEESNMDTKPAPVISVTAAAKQKMLSMVKAKNSRFILINVKPGGCMGMSYNIEVLDSQPKGFIVLDDKDLLVIIPDDVIHLLNGLNIDYVDNGMRAEFKFNNPNQKGCCGCGNSFCV